MGPSNVASRPTGVAGAGAEGGGRGGGREGGGEGGAAYRSGVRERVCTWTFAGLMLLRRDPLSGFPVRTWAALLALGLVVQAAAWWLVSRGMGQVRTNVAAVVLLLQPVATVFLGWGLLREAIKPLQGLGTLVILAGIALAAVNPERAPRGKVSPPARC